MEQQLPHIEISRLSRARPEAVYDQLADLRSHLDWGGVRQTRDFHLVSLDAEGAEGVPNRLFDCSAGTFRRLHARLAPFFPCRSGAAADPTWPWGLLAAPPTGV